MADKSTRQTNIDNKIRNREVFTLVYQNFIRKRVSKKVCLQEKLKQNVKTNY